MEKAGRRLANRAVGVTLVAVVLTLPAGSGLPAGRPLLSFDSGFFQKTLGGTAFSFRRPG